jgi:integrase
MASVHRRGNGRWQARYRESPGGPQRAKDFARKVDAERFLVDVQHRLLTRTYIDPRSGEILLGDYWADFATRRIWADGTAALYADTARRILPIIGGRPLEAVSTVEIEKLLAAMAARYSPGTVRTSWIHLRAVLNAARAEGRLATVPKPRLPKVQRKLTVPSEEAVEELYEAASARMRIAIELGARAGLRRSEALGLTVDRVDRGRLTITVDRQVAPRLGAGEPFRFAEALKTANSHRVVPVTSETIERLPSTSEHGLGLLLAVDGRGWAPTVFTVAWRELARRVGIGFTFHDLRHFFCTTALADGVNPKAVAKAAGMDPATLWSTYGHTLPDDDERMRLALRRGKAPLLTLAQPAEDKLRTAGRSEG